MTVMEYFPFLVNYMDMYGKDNYDYLNKVTKVTERFSHVSFFQVGHNKYPHSIKAQILLQFK